MSCTPERVTGYVDDALGPWERAEVEAHIATCAACLAQVAAERDLRAGLRALPVPEPRAGFEEDVRRRLAAQPRRRRAGWMLPLAASLVLLVLWGRGAASFVAWELSRDHTKCFGGSKLPAAVWSEDPVQVAAWFEDQGTRVPIVPASASSMSLVGARYCHLLDRYAAHLFYA
ncbi:MAG TPA: zf-HC2 domain-containing protein, partial [Vicinamibacteria bacterium]|nr:zf-HC2 domain-containing protein [Vicinamibacteria bacterium]